MTAKEAFLCVLGDLCGKTASSCISKEESHERSKNGVFYVCRNCQYGNLAYGVRQGLVGVVCPGGLHAFCRVNGPLSGVDLLEEVRVEIA